MAQKTLVIVDGHSLAFRAFYALPLLQTSSGLYTNAAYGFTLMLQKLVHDVKPHYIVVAFDKGKETFRSEMYTDYKSHRQKMPEELSEQMPYIEDILRAYRIPIFTLEGYEADDIIGTFASLADDHGELKTVIVTGDRDAYQLVSKSTQVMITRKGITDVKIVDMASVKEEFDIKPQQLIDVKALMGDSSDNIPGIYGIGEKTALKLIREFGSLESIYENLDKVKGKVLHQRLKEHKDDAFMSRRLARIVTDLPLELDLTDFISETPDQAFLWELFNRFEFKTMLDSLDYKPGTAQQAKTGEYQPIDSTQGLEEVMSRVREEGKMTLFVDSDAMNPMLATVQSIAISPQEGEVYYIAQLEQPWLDIIGRVLADSSIEKTVHHVKPLWILLRRHNIELHGVEFDTMLAAYLLNPSEASYALAELVEQYASKGLLKEGESLDPMTMACRQADLLWELSAVLKNALAENQLMYLFTDVELPLALVLGEMELEGIAVDADILKEMREDLEERIEVMLANIYDIAGEKFNVNSPKQLGHVLFDRLGLPVVKKTKTGYSTAAEVLEILAEQHQLPRCILDYRSLAKLKSTYVDGLLSLLEKGEKRIHTTYHQTITTTGRLSSAEPNLQNIPIRLEEGRRIRKAFVPGDNYTHLVSADYSQIELRILAHMSQDPILIQAFQEQQDIHSRTAAEVFGVSMEDVTKEMRHKAKAVNFGIIYGISDYGLTRDLGISRQEAAKYIDNYFKKYKGVKTFIEETTNQAREEGFVQTLLHRRRYLPEINARNFHRRAFAERTAVNTPIQGSAADLIKLAMVSMHKELQKRGYASRMILQVHDELLLEVPQDELTEIKLLLPQVMQRAMDLAVPIAVDVKVGSNWYDMEVI